MSEAQASPRADACRAHPRWAWVLAGLGLLSSVLAGPAVADDELDYGLERRDLAEVEIEGNQSFPDSRLRELLVVESAPWYDLFGTDRYRPDQLRQGVDAIRGFYRSRGYHQATVEVERIEERDLRGDIIHLRVEEGPQVLVESVTFGHPAPLTAGELRERLRYRAGGPAPPSRGELGGDLYRILDAYLVRGHLGARVRDQFSLGDSTATIHYEIDAGPIYTVRDVAFTGRQKTRLEHVERELRIHPGDPFDAKKIGQTEVELLDTGWFRDVSFEPVALDSTAAEADLRVRLIERETGFYELGIGTGDEERVRLSAAWGNRNVRGSGRSLTLRARLALVSEDRFDDLGDQQFNLDHREELLYRHPRLLGSRFDLNLNTSFRTESRPRSGVELERWGVVANTELYKGRWTSLALEAGVENVLRLPLDDSVDAGSFFPNRRAQTRFVTLVWERDTRDDIFQPHRGQERQLLFQAAGGPWLGGDNTFNKVLSSWVRFVPLSESVTLGLRAQLGWAEAWWKSDEDGVPFEDRFFAGGNRTVRGYRENSLGPRATAEDIEDVADQAFLANRPTAGGSALMLTNAELRFPLPLLGRWGFGGAVFLDGGNVWESWSEVALDQFTLEGNLEGDDLTSVRDYRLSWGVGLHYNTIVGPLRLDYGIPLHRAAFVDEEGNREVDPEHVWHFSLGHAF